MEQKMIHEILPVGILQCNCTILGDPETREALVLDPGDEIERILEIISRHSLTVRAIVSTHAHIDHVGGLKKLQQVSGAPVMMHADDLELYRHLDMQATFLGMRAPELAKVDQLLSDGDLLRWGPFTANVLHTPGHTRGSLSLYLPVQGSRAQAPPSAVAREAGNETASPTLFAGDTLFAGSIGRTDLWGGSLDKILKSIHQKLLALPEDTVVYPGHGPSTTIGQEKQNNPFLTR
jgi:hydroxyacylglutathione hydrolase